MPIDYYILLQDGYREKSKQTNEERFIKTNYVYMENVPLLQKKETYFKSSKSVKTILFEDIYRCTDRTQAEEILSDQYAEEELTRHLQDRYGLIEDSFFLNYDFDKILNRVGMGSMSKDTGGLVKKDVDAELQALLEGGLSQTTLDDESFESLITLSKGKLKEFKHEDLVFQHEDLLDQKRMAELDTEQRKKERDKFGLEKPIKRKGFFKFSSYTSKLKMMDTALFLFGMKLHRQVGSIEFFDADFSNTITVYSDYLIDKSLYDCSKIINETLRSSGFTGKLLEVGQLKDINDYDLNNIVVRKGLKISLRLNSFPDALNAFLALNQARFTSLEG